MKAAPAEQAMTLNELIGYSTTQASIRRRAAEQQKAADAERFKALLNSVTSDAIERVADKIPEPLLPHVTYTGHTPNEIELRNYPERWAPVEFTVKAPALVPITIRLAWPGGEPQVGSIIIESHYYADWIEAIADAARHYSEMEDAAKEVF